MGKKKKVNSIELEDVIDYDVINDLCVDLSGRIVKLGFTKYADKNIHPINIMLGTVQAAAMQICILLRDIDNKKLREEFINWVDDCMKGFVKFHSKMKGANPDESELSELRRRLEIEHGSDDKMYR